jgi:hypothetical protein
LEITGYVLSQYNWKFSEYCYKRLVPSAREKISFLDVAPVNVEYEPVKLLDYTVTVLKSDNFSTVTVALSPNPHTKAEVEKIIYSAHMDKSIEITDWMLDQIIGQVFGHHDKRITSVTHD